MTESMRLIFVSGAAGGAGASTLQLAAQLVACGHDVTVLMRSAQAPQIDYLYKRTVNLQTKLERRSRSLGRPVLKVSRLMGRRIFQETESPVRTLRAVVPENALRPLLRSRPDVVIANSIERVAWRRIRADLAAANIPAVLYLREEVALGHLSVSNAPPDLLLTNTSAYAKQAEGLGHPSVIIPSIVDICSSQTTPTLAKVVFVSPVPIHGVDIAWKLAEARPDIPFVFQESSYPVKGADLHALLDRAAGLPNVEFRPFQQDVAAVYRDARLLLLPHRVNNRPRVVLEAQANGIPVLATVYEGLIEAVGPGGLLVDPDAPAEEWVAALSRLWDDRSQYDRLAALARNHAARPEVQPQEIAARFETEITALLRGTHSNAGGPT